MNGSLHLSASTATERLAQLCAQSTDLGRLLKTLSKGGVQAYLVGGVVRDTILGRSTSEVDLAISASAIDAKALLERQNIRVVETGLQHGTVTAVMESASFELTSFRRLTDPSALGASIEEDLQARDFTVNAIAFDPVSRKLVDPTQGFEDIRSGILRTPSPAEIIFQQDPLRVMRLARFVSQFDFRPAQNVLATASTFNNALKSVSIERIREEFSKTVIGDHLASAFSILSTLEFFKNYIPEVELAKGFEQNEFHIHDVYEHTLWVLGRIPAQLDLRLAAFFHDLGKPASLSIGDDGRRHFFKHEIISAEICINRMEALSFSKQLTKHVARLVRMHMRPLDCGASGARRLIRDLEDGFEAWLEVKKADSPPVFTEEQNAQVMSNFLALLESVQKEPDFLHLAIDGNDLKQLGFSEGRLLGTVLKELREIVLDDPERNNREYLTMIAMERLP
jgi:tRNA nucleotidyltransferase (CCA-adding enzyme)